jgi:hypothetical protein
LSKARWKRKTDILRKETEIAICRQFLVPETAPFWQFLAPKTRNQKSPEWCTFWRHKLPKRFLFISGAINCQNGAVSGAINCQNGQQILYAQHLAQSNLTLIVPERADIFFFLNTNWEFRKCIRQMRVPEMLRGV